MGGAASALPAVAPEFSGKKTCGERVKGKEGDAKRMRSAWTGSLTAIVAGGPADMSMTKVSTTSQSGTIQRKTSEGISVCGRKISEF